MLARRTARVVVTLSILASLACSRSAEQVARNEARAAALQRASANAPGGVFATGSWFASMTGELQMQYSGNQRSSSSGNATHVVSPGRVVEREFMVEVQPLRDSARLSLVFDATATGGLFRQFPQSVRVTGDTMTFTLPYLIGWADVRCRLQAHGRMWDGTCHAREGGRMATLSLMLPRVASATRAR